MVIIFILIIILIYLWINRGAFNKKFNTITQEELENYQETVILHVDDIVEKFEKKLNKDIRQRYDVSVQEVRRLELMQKRIESRAKELECMEERIDKKIVELKSLSKKD